MHALRAKCRLIEDLADTQLDAALYAIAVVEMGRHEQFPEIRAAAARDLERPYGELERALSESRFFCGEYSLADMAVFPHLMAAILLGFPIEASRQRQRDAQHCAEAGGAVELRGFLELDRSAADAGAQNEEGEGDGEQRVRQPQTEAGRGVVQTEAHEEHRHGERKGDRREHPRDHQGRVRHALFYPPCGAGQSLSRSDYTWDASGAVGPHVKPTETARGLPCRARSYW